MPDPSDPPQPLTASEIGPLLAEISSLSATLPAFEPPRGDGAAATTPPRYFQASIQKNLEWSRHALGRLRASLGARYEGSSSDASRIAHSVAVLRGIVAALEAYDRRIDEMRLAQGEHVSLADILGAAAGSSSSSGGGGGAKKESFPYPSAAKLLDGPQRFTYYDPPR